MFIFSDTLILKIYFLIIKIDIFRGELSGISAKTATLLTNELVSGCLIPESVLTCGIKCLRALTNAIHATTFQSPPTTTPIVDSSQRNRSVSTFCVLSAMEG